ncbi:MAG TPA: MarR family transcriptional regulator [Anaerolineales bacterium]|nr:MarR family transcriptional regulator [Anaerolineales bacterium]HNN12326.1 MarR family transcriptional regulator [Anaerolineales bacterium]HNO30300.1 MarR family transcriptional regulator [Anaerolineales bacterium]
MTDSLQISKSMRQWVDMTTHRSMQGQARYVKALGFSMPQFFMLIQVFYKKQCGISDLSGHMEITTAAASQMVEKLVQSGLLERTEDPNDRRAKQVTLSPRGRELIESSINERFRWVDELVGSLSAKEKSVVVEALGILTEKAKELEK